MADLQCDFPPGDCIMFATADWDEPYWTNKQHCAKALSEMGIRVLYIESVGLRAPHTGSGRDWARVFNRLRKGIQCFLLGAPKRAPGIWVLSPLMIPAAHSHPVLGRLSRLLLSLAIKRSLLGKRFTRPLTWTYHPFMLEILAGKLKGKLLYHCVDDLAAVPGVDVKAFRQTEEILLRQADVVFATAKSLAERCKQINPNTHFLPNVVDAKHFGQALQGGPLPPEIKSIPEPRLVYHGVLSDFKLDFTLLLDAVQMRPEWHWVLIGEEREGQCNEYVATLRKQPNVHFLGYRSYDSLPNYLRGMQVGLLPTLINEYTHSMFPMKYYEYLAAGLPVVSTPLSFTQDIHNGLELGHGADGFVQAISRQLLRGRFTRDDVSCFIGENTWEVRTAIMLKQLKLKFPCVIEKT